MLERQSALASALAKGGRDGADGKRRCRLGEARGWLLLQVAGFPATIAEVERVLRDVAAALEFAHRVESGVKNLDQSPVS